MKIDYDKPVRGRLTKGYYWICGMKNARYPTSYPPQEKQVWTQMAVFVWRHQAVVPLLNDPANHIDRDVTYTVLKLRRDGWQFYPARLPRPRKGSKEE